MYGRIKGRRLSKKQKLFLRNHGKDLIFDYGKMEELEEGIIVVFADRKSVV